MTIDALDRLDAIRSRLDLDGRVRVVEMAESLGVSEMTVRRDLDLLAEQGVLLRVRGGAAALGAQPFAARFARQAKAKERIVAKVAHLVGDGGAVGIDASSTLERLASSLRGVRDVTVLTNGPECFLALQAHPGVTALLTGGQLDRRTGSLVGPMAVRSTQDLRLRRLFVSAAGIDPDHGTSEPTLEEAEVKLAMADASTHVVVAVDHTKLGHHASARCLPLERVDLLVTDLDPSDPRLDPYRGGVELA